ncbi:hypothetical protein G6F56_003272 [Rhizopus delemar]|nr:hypothetical protein G6F56_003272 [Rhizopus delemar]
MLQSNEILMLKACFLACLSKVINDVLKPVFSLRSTLALDGLEFISELGNHLGDKLHLHTIETIISNLVKCCSTSNKIIFSKANEVAISFLQKVRFSTRIVVTLCKTIDDKNNQVRQSAAEFLKTILKVYARNFQGSSSISLQKYIKKGLTDASPGVRESSRQAYWMYYEHWPKEAEKICLEMDSGTLKQLKASQKKSPLINRSNSLPTVPQKDGITKKSSLKRSSSTHDYAKSLPKIPSSSMKSTKRILRDSRLSNVSHISHMSAPAASIKHKQENRLTTTVPRKTKSEFHENHAIKKKEKEKEMPVLMEELFDDEDNASIASSILSQADNLLMQEIDFSIYEGLSDFDPCTETPNGSNDEVELLEKNNLQSSPLASPKPGQIKMIEEKEVAHGTPERTKISRKADEELRPEEEVKKRHVSEEAEVIREKEVTRGTPERTKISRKADEELRPDENIKERHVSEEAEMIREKELTHGTPEPTRISCKATEELKPDENIKERHVSEEPEQTSALNDSNELTEGIEKEDASKEPEKTLISNDSSKSEEEIKKEHVPGRTYNPTLENLNQVARENLDNIHEGIERMKAGSVDVSLLCDLQIVSRNTPILDIYNVDVNSIFWLYDLARPFRYCLKEVVNLIQDEKTAPFIKYEAIHLASSLIQHQKALFLRFKKPIINRQASYLYPFIRALSKAHTFPSAKKAINDLLAIYPPDVSEILLKDTYKK